MLAMNYENIQQFLKSCDRDNVIYCYGNNAVADMVKNLVNSANSVGLNMVLFALDKKIAKALSGRCDVVNYFDEDIQEDTFYVCGDKAFRNIVWQGWFAGNEILRSGRSCICLDVDVVVRKDFEEDILRQFADTECDCLIQFNGKNACAGFCSLRPTERAIEIFGMDFLNDNQYCDYAEDQAFFNLVVLKKKFLDIKFLDRDDYPNGKYYYENHERIGDTCKIVHFNCVEGYETKVNKMKEHGLWHLR